MSLPSILKGTYIDVMVAEPAGSNTFVKLCGITTNTFTTQKNSSDQFIADCDDPEDIPVRLLNITGRQWDISGNGFMNRAQAPLIRTLLTESTARTFRVQIAEPDDEDIDAGYYQGPAQVMNAQIGRPEGSGYASLSVAIASDGEFVWVPAA